VLFITRVRVVLTRLTVQAEYESGTCVDKPTPFQSLLVADAFGRHVKHNVLRVRVGLPVEHDNTYLGPVCWR
jgi:hypothetical protein